MTTAQAAFTCPECGKSLKNKSALRGHYQFGHPGVEIPEEVQASGQGGGRAGARVANPPPIEEQETKESQFAALAMHLGIRELTAKATAWYVCNNYDPDDPEQLQEALKRRTDLTPAERMQLWESWTNRVNPGAATKFQKQAYDALIGNPGQGPGSPREEGLDKRVYGIAGGMVVKDKEQGLTYHEASALAWQQMRLMGGAHDMDNRIPWDAIIKSISERPDTLQEAIAALKSLQPQQDQGKQDLLVELVNTKIAAQTDSFSQTVQLLQQSHKAEMELMREQQNNQIKSFTESLERIGDAINRETNPWETLDKILPGSSQRIVEMLTGGGRKDPSVVIKLPEGDMTLDAYERWENIQNKRETMKWVREITPEFIQMGKDLANAATRVADAEKEQELRMAEEPAQGDHALPPGLASSICVRCGQLLSYKITATSFSCPVCQTVQTTDGQILEVRAPEPQVTPESPDKPPSELPEAVEPEREKVPA